MNSKQLKESDILLWACNYLPSQRVFNMEFQDGQLISELIYQFQPSIKRLEYCNQRPKMILSLGYIKDFLHDNKIPIDFDVHRVASQSQSDILKLLFDIRQYFGSKQEQNPQKQKLNNWVKQSEKSKNIQPSPIRQSDRQQSSLWQPQTEQQSISRQRSTSIDGDSRPSLLRYPIRQRERKQQQDIWYPPSAYNSIQRQRSTSIDGGSRLSGFQQFSSKIIQEYQSQSIRKSPILDEQELIAKQDRQPQNYFNQQVNPNSQQSLDNRDRDTIQQQIQQAVNQQKEINKFVSQIQEFMAKSKDVLEFKILVNNGVINAIQRNEYLTFHLWLDAINQFVQPQDEGLILAGSMLRAYLGQNLSNIQILPSFSQWPLWQQLTQRSIQRTNDAQIQCDLPSQSSRGSQYNFQNK